MNRAHVKLQPKDNVSNRSWTSSLTMDLYSKTDFQELPAAAPVVEQGDTDAEVERRHHIKYGRPLQAIWGLFSDYATNSSIHGVQYMGERRRPLVERIWWIIAFSASIYGCSRLIHNVWIKWDQSPVIVTFSEKSTPIWHIPFPAVTMCPEKKIHVKNYTTIFKNFNQVYKQRSVKFDPHSDTVKAYEAIHQVCNTGYHPNSSISEDTADAGMVHMMTELNVKLNEVMSECKWRNKLARCDKLFSPILTEEGVCFTFNILRAEEMFRVENMHEDYNYLQHNKTNKHWCSETGYSPNASLSSYPVRVLSSGANAGLFVQYKMHFKTNFGQRCRGPVQGFKILLHTPDEMPRLSRQFFRAPINNEVVVAVKPNMITTDKGLQEYNPIRRQCFFSEERHLHFFKVYTQQNCELECLANYTMAQCECVKFSMPRAQNTPICSIRKFLCYTNAEEKMQRQEIVNQMKVTHSNGSRIVTNCNCLPACTSITYDPEISQADFTTGNLKYNKLVLEENGFNYSLARLSIFFKENQFITSRRSELYGLTEFIANCGGLLGLFMGVSILSIVEIIYYMTIRLFCNLNMRRRRKATLIRRKCGISTVSNCNSEADDQVKLNVQR